MSIPVWKSRLSVKGCRRYPKGGHRSGDRYASLAETITGAKVIPSGVPSLVLSFQLTGFHPLAIQHRLTGGILPFGSPNQAGWRRPPGSALPSPGRQAEVGKPSSLGVRFIPHIQGKDGSAA